MNIEDIIEEPTPAPTKNACLCVVRLTTTAWHDKDGAYLKKTLRYLKRKCSGYNVLDDECNMVGTLDGLNHIVNLYRVEDGVYEVRVCNMSRDWETGIVDDYDLELKPIIT